MKAEIYFRNIRQTVASMLRLVLIACLLTGTPVYSYSGGAPTSACNNGLVPNHHHAQPQNTTAPYSFSGADSFKSSDKFKETLSGKPFLGFIVQAHDLYHKPVGTFKVIEKTKSQLLKCSADGDTLTHVHLNKNPITSVEFEWLAPDDYVGIVTLVATVVVDYDTFWVASIKKLINVN